jgi:membrane protein YdbS with pleckstrin-like domain
VNLKLVSHASTLYSSWEFTVGGVFRMSTTSHSSTVIWVGRPWIAPDAAARTVLVIVIVAFFIWLESIDNAASSMLIGIPIWTWTILIFLIIWMISLVPLFLLRAAHKYTLRSGSLEVKTGIASLQSFVLSPSGFSDLEINQSVIGRMVNFGDIVIHTQSDRTAKMQKVKEPNRIASQIRDYMGRPIVRIEGEPQAETK